MPFNNERLNLKRKKSYYIVCSRYIIIFKKKPDLKCRSGAKKIAPKYVEQMACT